MASLTRARRARRRIVKTQRRLWLAQLAMWPTLVLVAIGAVAALAVRLRGSRTHDFRTHDDASAQPIDGLPHL
ncbi:hypothetical protein [Mycolicibacterium elephantis]